LPSDAIFRHAAAEGFVSIRSFYEDDSGGSFLRHLAVGLRGDRPLISLIDAAEHRARLAAQEPRPVVCCPMLATFSNSERAREIDILEGPTLSVECDEHPQQARRILEQLLGPATVVVKSGGVWINGGNEGEDKLHLHWRLVVPARGDNLAKLKEARRFATKLVGADRSNVPVCHAMRWPGSWHRKKTPRLCVIETLNADVEIDLDAAFAALKAAMRGAGPKEEPGPEKPKPELGPRQPKEDEDGASDAELIGKILSGENYHAPLTQLAARYVGRGCSDSQIRFLLRGLMLNSRAPRDDRWQSRLNNDIDHAIKTARDKYGPEKKIKAPLAPELLEPPIFLDALKEMQFEPLKFVVPTVIVEGLTLLAGKPKIGKSWLLLHAAINVARGGFTLGEIKCPEGDAIYYALEDNKRRIKSRAMKLLGPTADWPKRLAIKCAMPRLSEGGLDVIKSWITSVKEPRFVVIDTLAMVRPLRSKIGIGGSLAAPPLPHHLAYGSVPRRFEKLR
jgi:hypothetical protein